jgi:hypothetical protein
MPDKTDTPTRRTVLADMYVASESFVDEKGNAYHKDITRVSGELVSKNKWQHLFKPLEVSNPAVESATAAPGEKRGS